MAWATLTWVRPVRIYCLLFCCAVGKTINAQEHVNLSGILNTYTASYPKPSDTSRIMAILRQGEKLQYTFPDSAIVLFREVERQGRATNFYDGIVFALMDIGTIYTKKSPRESILFYMQALSYCDKTIKYDNLSLMLYNNIAAAYHLMGAYREASEYYFYALQKLMQRYSYTHPYTISIFSNLAIIQIRLREYGQALYFLNKAEKIARQNRQVLQLAAILKNKGDTYAALQQTEKAMRYYKESMQYGRETGNPEIQQSVFNALGKLMLQENKPYEAIRYVQEGMKISDKTNPYYASIMPGYLLGEAYYQTGDYRKAEANILPALTRAQKLGIREDMILAYKALGDVYQTTGRYREASLYQQAYIQLKDTLMSRENTMIIHQLEIKYRSAEKDKEIIEKQLLINQQHNRIKNKNIWIGGITTGALTIILFLAVLYRNYRHKQRLQASRIQMLEQQQEISQLKAAIQGAEQERKRIAVELHDGIGGLLAAAKMNFTAVKRQFPDVSAAHDFADGLQLLKEASGELRKTAHNLKPDGLLREGLVRAVHVFCTQLMKGHDLRLDIQVYGTVELSNADFELSVFRIIQELVHNIIKHAMATEALVELSMHNHILNITVADNGKGFTEEIWQHGTGIGLSNIRSRVQALKGRIDITSNAGSGTAIYLEFEAGSVEHFSSMDV